MSSCYYTAAFNALKSVILAVAVLVLSLKLNQGLTQSSSGAQGRMPAMPLFLPQVMRSVKNLAEYVLKKKIEEGKILLLYTDKPAVDIALYLGFSSQSHISRTFKKYVDTTPIEYRKREN